MGNKLVFFTLLSFIATRPVLSQITLGNNNMPGNNDTLRYTNVLPASVGNYTQTGTNFNWNFTNVTSLNEGVRSFKNALQTPYAFFFLALNEYGEKVADSIGFGPVIMTNYYNYYKKQSSPAAFVADGAGLTYSNVPMAAYYTDKDELYMFPMTYPKHDSTKFRFAVAPPLLPMKYTKTGYRITDVDGWGTVTTPYGTGNCLRIVTTQYSMDSVKLSLFSFGFPAIQRSYQWMTTTSKIPFFEVTGNMVLGNFVPTLVRYRGYDKSNPTGVSEELKENAVAVFPNPVKDDLYFSSSEEFSSFRIYDMTGKEVHSGAIRVEKRIDLRSLASGTYILQLNGAQGLHHSRFLKE